MAVKTGNAVGAGVFVGGMAIATAVLSLGMFWALILRVWTSPMSSPADDYSQRGSAEENGDKNGRGRDGEIKEKERGRQIEREGSWRRNRRRRYKRAGVNMDMMDIEDRKGRNRSLLQFPYDTYCGWAELCACAWACIQDWLSIQVGQSDGPRRQMEFKEA